MCIWDTLCTHEKTHPTIGPSIRFLYKTTGPQVGGRSHHRISILWNIPTQLDSHKVNERHSYQVTTTQLTLWLLKGNSSNGTHQTLNRMTISTEPSRSNQITSDHFTADVTQLKQNQTITFSSNGSDHCIDMKAARAWVFIVCTESLRRYWIVKITT